MPKRVIDFDAMWGSDKLASCAAWAQAEYAWLYGLADASGCFEMTNLRVIWGRVAAIRENFTIERLEQVFGEFQDKGLLFVWEHEGKRYAHWTGSDMPGRLPPPSWRMRLEKLAPPVPKRQLAEYMARFSRGRAALAGVGFGGGAEREAGRREEDLRFENSDLREGKETAKSKEDLRIGNSDSKEVRRSGIKGGVEEAQGQDLNLNLGLDWKLNGEWEVGVDGKQGASANAIRVREFDKPNLYDSTSQTDSNATAKSNAPDNSRATSDGNSNTTAPATAKSPIGENINPYAGSAATLNLNVNSNSNARANTPPGSNANARGSCTESARPAAGPVANGNREWGSAPFANSAKDLAVARELRVGQGPVCGPMGVRAEVLERVRQRDAARARAGTRSP